MNRPSTFTCFEERDRHWYDLFSRGARDWLRHNEKISKAVRDKLPELMSDADVLGSTDSTVKVPVRFMEHFRFKLRPPEEQNGAGQGKAQPGDKLGKAQPKQGDDGQKEAGGSGEGGYDLVLEFKIDDIIDWLWEELKLPNLQPKAGVANDDDLVREGWNRRGARSRLDRRRSMREAIKRRAVDLNGPAFTDDDLRYRQLTVRQKPATKAVVFFAMDVSSSMRDNDRRLAKTFFFWVIQGLQRQYQHIEPVFIAHTVKAWEFDEQEFFQVRGSGGTVASSAFNVVNDIIGDRYDPSQYNVYLFYASDGENFRDDHDNAEASLGEIGRIANYLGYVETPATAERALQTETAKIFDAIGEGDVDASSFALTDNDSVWEAIRGFFQEQAGETAS
ncbi:MAG: DUF444 family protein [Gammaproteobacteria bacterium]|nr:DUF444 family protein [Gammaproteobacteria bacterium]NND36192.1 DUF444 family protein [Gammaproteobacteria bacterium]